MYALSVTASTLYWSNHFLSISLYSSHHIHRMKSHIMFNIYSRGVKVGKSLFSVSSWQCLMYFISQFPCMVKKNNRIFFALNERLLKLEFLNTKL